MIWVAKNCKLVLLLAVMCFVPACIHDMGFTSQDTLNDAGTRQYDEQWIQEQQRYYDRNQPGVVYR